MKMDLEIYFNEKSELVIVIRYDCSQLSFYKQIISVWPGVN